MDEQRGWWYFTFGCGQQNAGHYVKLFGTMDEARRQMFARYGDDWAFQYSEKSWKEWVKRCHREGIEWMLETEI